MFYNAEIIKATPYQTNKPKLEYYMKMDYNNSTLAKTKTLKWQIIEKANTNLVLKKEQFSNELVRLNYQFSNSFTYRKSLFKSIPYNNIIKRFNEVAQNLLHFDYISIQTGATDDLSIYFKIHFDSITALFEIFFDDEQIGSSENILNIMENKKLTFSKSGDLDFLFTELQKTTKQKGYSNKDINSAHEISGTFITSNFL
jgi:hypothetical protein